MERVVVQNQYHARQAAYRGLEEVLMCKVFFTQNVVKFHNFDEPGYPSDHRRYGCLKDVSDTCVYCFRILHDLISYNNLI